MPRGNQPEAAAGRKQPLAASSLAAPGWVQSVGTRRLHRDTRAGSDACQRSFTKVGNRPKAVYRLEIMMTSAAE